MDFSTGPNSNTISSSNFSDGRFETNRYLFHGVKTRLPVVLHVDKQISRTCQPHTEPPMGSNHNGVAEQVQRRGSEPRRAVGRTQTSRSRSTSGFTTRLIDLVDESVVAAFFAFNAFPHSPPTRRGPACRCIGLYINHDPWSRRVPALRSSLLPPRQRPQMRNQSERSSHFAPERRSHPLSRNTRASSRVPRLP